MESTKAGTETPQLAMFRRVQIQAREVLPNFLNTH